LRGVSEWSLALGDVREELRHFLRLLFPFQGRDLAVQIIIELLLML